jgi:hypothetical protein
VTYAARLEKLAASIKETMNKPVEEGGLWKKEGAGGYYVQMRSIVKGSEHIEEQFIPYDNLVPMWCGMTDHAQDLAIFGKLDDNFSKIYDLTYGPMYCAPAGHNEKSVMKCSSVTWLAFLDIYLRGEKGYEKNRREIYDLLIRHSHDAGGILFPEGAGVYGSLTGGAGRSWDNGNYFHMLVCGFYGLEKSKDGIVISNPDRVENLPLTELKNFCWRQAVYNFQWNGEGRKIKKIICDGTDLKLTNGEWLLDFRNGTHRVEVVLGK